MDSIYETPLQARKDARVVLLTMKAFSDKGKSPNLHALAKHLDWSNHRIDRAMSVLEELKLIEVATN